MKITWMLSLLAAATAWAVEKPAQIVTEGVPEIPASLRERVAPYLEFRSASFQGWHPVRREMAVLTRLGASPQLHWLKAPGGARRQLTFLPEPVRGASLPPAGPGDFILFSHDVGGGEFFQFARYDLADGSITRLTDGSSRNTNPVWSRDGRRLAFASTRRTGKDTDVWIMDPQDPASARLLLPVEGGGWSPTDWSPDGTLLAVREYISANESHLWVVHTQTGERRRITPADGPRAARSGAVFSSDGQFLFHTSDEGSEFHRLGRTRLSDGRFDPLTRDLAWDVESFALSPDGRVLAYVANEAGQSRLRFAAAVDGATVPAEPKLPAGVIGSLEWRADSSELGFTFSSARSPGDAWSLHIATGQLTRWTESETGGLPASTFAEPELWRLTSFDGVEVTGFVYRPDAQKFPGPRPVIISIHGGPESQSRPVFQGRNNFYLNELGAALVVPNVRGSSGFGKTFLALDNGLKRMDAVKDIGAFLDRIVADPALDASRVAVMGGSYGGFMTLASLIEFGDRLRCGIDRVGISNFLTFLQLTQDYRRDLRRAEYGDERDPAMRAFLEKISPLNNVAALRRPLLVVQGLNDPRVPEKESRQMVDAVRQQGGVVWYLLAKDEGHGFAKKPNLDYQFLVELLFLQEYLLK